MNKKSIRLLLLSLLIALPLGGCGEKQSNEEMQKQFDEFIQEEFVSTIEDEYLNMHVYLENPQNYGIDPSKVTVQIGDKFQEGDADEDRKENKELQEKFSQFDREQLTEEQQDTYDCFKYMLDISTDASDEKFDYMGSAFNTMTGDYTQIPNLFADFVLRDETDVKDLITLLKDVLPYMESDLAYTKKQAEQGTLSISIDEIIEHCQKIVDAGMEGSTLSSMKAHVDELQLSDDAKQSYKQQLEQAYKDSFLPAYQSIIDTMNELRDADNHTTGLANMKNGKEFYEILFRQATGSDATIEEVKAKLEKEAQRAMSKASMLVLSDNEAYDAYVNNTVRTGFQDYQSILTHLETAYKKDFPDVGKLTYQIEPLPADLSTSGIMAYFNIPAIDGTTPKQIRVNNTAKSDIDIIDTFTTVAHEGIPGHMYQIQYAYNNIDNPWRLVCTNFSGYTEGYATYVELYSLNYLDADETVKKLHDAMSVYEHSIIALIDIGIHYEGWTVDDLADFCNEKGLDGSQAQLIYDQICYNPTAFLSYYVGYQEIIDLKEKAQEALGDKFSELAFHEALLESGSAPFSVIERHINAYIDSAK